MASRFSASSDDPLKRAAADLATRFSRGFLKGSQPLLLLDPIGYGASRVLDDFVEMCAQGKGTLSGLKVGALSERSDEIDDLTSLLLEIAAIASAGPNDLPAWRRRLLDWRRHRGHASFRQDIDRYLTDILRKASGVVLCVPRIDKVLGKLSSRTSREDLELCRYIEAHPIRLVATAPATWRAKIDVAFFEKFWIIEPELYSETDLIALTARLRLKGSAKDVLSDLSMQLGARPQLLERAAGILALAPHFTAERVLKEIGRTPPILLIEQLEAASIQALKILAYTTVLPLPADIRTIARAANVSAKIGSVQMGRLAHTGLVSVIRAAGVDHLYDFADPVARSLYAAMVDVSK